MDTLEQVIRSRLTLSAPKSNGWYPILCKVCNDHGRKGERGAFLFNGPIVSYNCFNCGHTAIHDSSQSQFFSDKMTTVLDAFGIPKDIQNRIQFNSLAAQISGPLRAVESQKREALFPKEIPLLPFFVPLSQTSKDEQHAMARAFLKGRQVVSASYPFYVVESSNHPDYKRWVDRVIIPVYRNNQVVFWQGRDMLDVRERKYLSADVPRSAIISNYDVLHGKNDDPLFVVEGWFDAYFVNGVAVFSNKLTQSQIEILSQSRREKVIIPDKSGRGFVLAAQALQQGWSISLPDLGECKDVNAAVMKYGKLYTIAAIKRSIHSGNLATALLEVYCSDRTDNRHKKNNKAIPT